MATLGNQTVKVSRSIYTQSLHTISQYPTLKIIFLYPNECWTCTRPRMKTCDITIWAASIYLLYFWDLMMLVTWVFINIPKLSSIDFYSNIRHQHRCFIGNFLLPVLGHNLFLNFKMLNHRPCVTGRVQKMFLSAELCWKLKLKNPKNIFRPKSYGLITNAFRLTTVWTLKRFFGIFLDERFWNCSFTNAIMSF